MNAFPEAIDQGSKWWSFLTAHEKQITILKSVATRLILAVSVAASAALAFRNPKAWSIGALSITIVNLYALPKILRYGNAAMIKAALTLNLVSTGSLMLGGTIAACFSVSSAALIGLQSFKIAQVIMSGFFATGLIGYVVPRALEALGRAHEIVNKVEWNEKIENLQEKFNQLPEIGLGLLQCNLWRNFLMHLTLVMPKWVLGFCNVFDINPSDEVWALGMLSANRLSLNEFQNELNSLIDINLYARLELDLNDDDEMPEEEQAEAHQQINTLLRSLHDNDFQKGIEFLLSNTDRLCPSLLSKSRYLELFQGYALETTNGVCKQFIDQMADWDALVKKYWSLILKITFLEIEVNGMQPDQKEELLQKYKNLNQDFLAIRSQVEKIYSYKRMWQPFSNVDDDKELPFEQAASLLNLLKSNQLMGAIDGIHRSLYGTGAGNGNNGNLADMLLRISNKVSISEEDDDEKEEEEESLIEILGANHAFIIQDYNDLQVWLDLESPHEIEEKLAAIGLKTEKDLFENEILSHTEQLTKEQIRKNLEAYINNAVNDPDLVDQATRMPKDALNNVPANAPVHAPYSIWKKTARVVFNLINGGLIAVPVLFQPIAGAAGFACGTCYFILRRFNVYGTEMIAENMNDLFKFLPAGNFIKNLLTRPIFSFNQDTRKRRDYFVDGDFYSRCRIINLEMLLALFIGAFKESGSFSQGVAISQQVVKLF